MLTSPKRTLPDQFSMANTKLALLQPYMTYFGTSRHMMRRATLNICASLQPPILGSEKAQGRKLYHNSFECLQKIFWNILRILWASSAKMRSFMRKSHASYSKQNCWQV